MATSTISWDNTVRSYLAAYAMSRINTYAGAGSLLLLCSGTRPKPGAGSPVAMCTLVCGTLFVASRSGWELTLTAIPAVSASGGGVAPGTDCTWIRHTTSAGLFIADYSVTATGGSGDITMDNIKVVTGATMTPGVMTLTVRS